MASFENSGFLHRKDPNLFRSSGVEGAVKRKEILEGKKTSVDALARIQVYLDRLKGLVDRKDPEIKARGVQAVKRLVYLNFVIKPEEIPESFWKLQEKIAREQGRGKIDITHEVKKHHAEVLIADQKSTLDPWIEYLTGPDALYPDYLKFWTIRSILNMGEYDKEKRSFAKRSSGTTSPFPDLNQEALAYVLDAIEKKYRKPEPRPYGPITEEQYIQDNAFGPITEEQYLIENESFSKLYAFAIEKVTPASKELLRITKGEWKEYKKDSDHLPLVKSLQGHGTGWCTAGESTAQAQLSKGDFHVFYSFDENGNPTIPRVAIRMEGDSIAEVRGIAHQQNLDSFISPNVSEKLKEFPDGKRFQKKVEDMNRLTHIERKMDADQQLPRHDLVFLYEIDHKIQGFGYDTDPRIKELRGKRDPLLDASIVFECSPAEIAHSRNEITERTKAYVGPLFKGIFQQTSHLENVYTSFPDGKIGYQELMIGGQTADQLEMVMEEGGIKVFPDALRMMKYKNFIELMTRERLTLVHLKVSDLFNDRSPQTTAKIYAKARTLGLDLCPPEVGPRLRVSYTDQQVNEFLYIAMKQIPASDRGPSVFLLRIGSGLDDGKPCLRGVPASPSQDEWQHDDEFVFCVRNEQKIKDES